MLEHGYELTSCPHSWKVDQPLSSCFFDACEVRVLIDYGTFTLHVSYLAVFPNLSFDNFLYGMF